MKQIKATIFLLLILLGACRSKPNATGQATSLPSEQDLTPESTIFSTGQASEEASIGMTIYTSESNNITFTDPNLGYSIDYPENWYLHIFTSPKREGYVESILISDAPGNTSMQTRTPDETARLWIASYDLDEQSLSDWVIGNWNWISGPVVELMIDDHSALNARFTPSDALEFSLNIVWIDLESTALVLSGSIRSDSAISAQSVEQIIHSIRFVSRRD